MGNLQNFSDTFQSAWVGEREARIEYEKALEKLEKYKGSKGYQHDVEAAEKTYHDRIDAIHADAEERLKPVLKSMERACRGGAYESPTAEQLRLLEALKMRAELLSFEDMERAAPALADCDVAVAALEKLARDAGKVVPPSFGNKYRARKEAFTAFQNAFRGLCAWNGAEDAEVLGEEFAHRNVLGGGDGKHNPDAIDAAHVARLGGPEMSNFEYKKADFELARMICGEDVPWDGGIAELD